MTGAPWEQTPDGYRFTHNPAWELRQTDQGYTLINTATGSTVPISGQGGLYYALDMAEGVVLGGLDGTRERNMFQAGEGR